MITTFQLLAFWGKSCGGGYWLQLTFLQLFQAFHEHGVLLPAMENGCRDNFTHLGISFCFDIVKPFEAWVWS